MRRCPRSTSSSRSSLLSGYLSTLCRRQGRLGVPIENFVPNAAQNSANNLAKRSRIEIGQRIAGYHLRRAPLIIAETEHLKRSIARHWQVREDHRRGRARGRPRPVRAAGPGRGQAAARHRPRRARPRLLGVLDATHDRARCSRRWPGCAIRASRCTWWATASCARSTKGRPRRAASTSSSTAGWRTARSRIHCRRRSLSRALRSDRVLLSASSGTLLEGARIPERGPPGRDRAEWAAPGLGASRRDRFSPGQHLRAVATTAAGTPSRSGCGRWVRLPPRWN